MRRPLFALSVVIALVLATFGTFASGAGGLSADRRMPELSSSSAVAAQIVVAAPAELRSVPQRGSWALTTAMAAILAALFGFAALRPKRVLPVASPNTQVRLRGPPLLRGLAFFAP